MSTLLFKIFIVFFILLLFGGIFYLIYLPVKLWLLKSGKLTKKQSNRINITYISILILSGIFLLLLGDKGRTPTRERLESISKIKLPSKFKVLKDEYQDMLQDYCIQYEIQLDSNSRKDLILSIQSSPFYNSTSLGRDDYPSYITINSVFALWFKNKNGYEFSKPYKQPTYSIQVDTILNKLTYQECSD
ncbi:MAG: hypothetical protein DI598_14620 [Pseudopedobacter saltans]|uniref:Uncharacterized protein n=1 Tax=Pseudopedobacter saltans TaxID=151895 RepID=A0A2W5EPE7_9SPHI|nr:MAG: hypothetical protein DI598_14620 [Pseudopedobacter saltans]